MGSKRYSNKGVNAAQREAAAIARNKNSHKATLLISLIAVAVLAAIVAIVILVGPTESQPSGGNIIDHGDHTHVAGVEDDLHDNNAAENQTAGTPQHGGGESD